MRYLFLIISSFFLLNPLQAQTLEGAYSVQGKELATSAIGLTAIAGQPFEGTPAGSLLSYGFIETVSTANEYTNVVALTLEKEQLSVEVGEQQLLTAAFSPKEVANPLLG